MRNGSTERVSLDRTAGIVEAFVESAPIGFALLDRELRFVRVNARMAEINGVPPAAHVGRRLQEVVPELPVESYLPVLERALAGEATEAVELTGKTPSQPGVTRWWLESWSPVRGSTGEVIGVAAFVVEISDRKRAETQLREAEARGLAHAEALAKLSAEAARALTVADLAAVVANHAPPTVDAAFANVALIEPAGDRLRVFHAETLDDAIAERWREVPLTAPVPLAHAVAAAAPVFVASPEDNARRYPSLATDTERAGLAATASLPLLARDGAAFGAIGFAWRSPQEFGPALRARLQTVAELAAQSLQRATRYEAERRAREQVLLTAEVTAAVSDTGSLSERMARMCDLLVRQFADLAIAELLGQDGVPASLVCAHRDAAALERLREGALAAEAPHATARLPAAREPQHLPDVDAALSGGRVHDPRTLELLAAIGARSYVGAPLRAGNRVVGTLILASTASGRRFEGEDVAFAAELGERAGLLLDNARLVEAEHEIATELQQRLLPSSLTVPSSVGVAARYRPAHARLGVGGDWYDVAELADGGLAIAVGDIVGHGPRAAAAMGQLRSAFAALAPAAGPAELLHRFDAFAARTPDAEFSSVCLALLDPTTGALRYACAGHPPPMVIQADGSVHTLDEGRSPLLAATSRTRPEAMTTLPIRARLLLYTDGLIERRTSSLDAGFQRLADAARSQRGLELEDFCDAVLAEMLSHEPTADDVAILCLERLAPIAGESRAEQ